MPPANNEVHRKFIAEMQGQTMHVPNMLAMFPNWPHCGRNKYYRQLKVKLDEIVENVYPDPVKRKRAMKNDFAFFASIWYPEADWEHVYAAGVFSFWIFFCDDYMDENEDQVSLDFDASNQFREQVLAYTRYWLGLEPVSTKPATSGRLSWLFPGASGGEDRGWTHAFLAGLGYKTQKEPVCPNLPCGTFKEFGQLVQRDFSKVFREMFWQELKDYFDHCEIEQRERLTGQFSDSFESYVAIRKYTSAVPVYCYITQIAYGAEIPTWLLETPEMKKLWEECDVNIIIGNDILSAKKELNGGCVHNAVPVMYHAGQPLDEIIPDLISKLAAVRDSFDETAQKVQRLAVKCTPKVRKDLDQYIDGLRTIATGTIEFCKIAERYGLEKYFNDDGTMDVVL